MFLRQLILLTTLVSLIGLSGCTAMSVGEAMVMSIPRLVLASGSTRTVRQDRSGVSVREDRQAWSRVVTDLTGSPLAPGSSIEGGALLVWDVPIRIGPEVGAVAGLGREECAYNVARPASWQLLRADLQGQMTPVGEAWRTGLTSSPSKGELTLDPVQAEAIATHMSVSANYRLTWLLVVPGAGDYVLRVAWLASGAGLRGKPCIDAWGVVSLDDAINATTPVLDRKTIRVTPATPFEVYQQAVKSPSVTEPSGAIPMVDADHIDQRFGLLGVPEYDLIRLHQAALAVEVGSQVAPEIATTLRARREEALSQLLRVSPDALCSVTSRHSLDIRGLGLWQGEPTVPKSLKSRACGSWPDLP